MGRAGSAHGVRDVLLIPTPLVASPGHSQPSLAAVPPLPLGHGRRDSAAGSPVASGGFQKNWVMFESAHKGQQQAGFSSGEKLRGIGEADSSLGTTEGLSAIFSKSFILLGSSEMDFEAISALTC